MLNNENDKREFITEKAHQKFGFAMQKGFNIPIFVKVFDTFYNRPLHCAGDEQYRKSLD